MTRAPRRCTWCQSLEHTARLTIGGCPERIAFHAEADRERVKATLTARRCETCGDEPATVQMFMGKVNRGSSEWVGPKCAAMFEQLARLLGGSPHRGPRLTVVR